MTRTLQYLDALLLALVIPGTVPQNQTVPTSVLTRKSRTINQAESLSTLEMATFYGYPAEAHSVVTEDGYILKLHRIPQGAEVLEYNKGEPRPVVLLMHCLLCSSKDWFFNFPDKSLGYILADSGYDVWLVNARGNLYSRKHVSLSPDEKEFWLFSFHEIAIYDLPASIDYSLRISGSTKLTYLGYSMGSAVLYALMSERPEYNQKVKAAAMLGPAAYLTNSHGNMFRFSPLERHIQKIGDLLGFWEIGAAGKLFNVFATTLCSEANFHLNGLCLFIYSLGFEIDPYYANKKFLPFILSSLPAGGSLRTVLHFMQVKNADLFQQYDFGETRNMQVYGLPLPPLYYINKTVTPVALFTARGDEYVRAPDSNRLARELPNVALRYEVPDPKFSHWDFLWANDATDILYTHVLSFLSSYQ